jgi:hypothetical protein
MYRIAPLKKPFRVPVLIEAAAKNKVLAANRRDLRFRFMSVSFCHLIRVCRLRSYNLNADAGRPIDHQPRRHRYRGQRRLRDRQDRKRCFDCLSINSCLTRQTNP